MSEPNKLFQPEQDYENFITMFNQQYDNYPTSLVDMHPSEQELADQSYYDAMGRYCASEGEARKPERRGRRRGRRR